MSTACKPPLIDHFADLDDPRVDRTKEHPLINVLFIAIRAVISGAEGGSDMETFGESKREWLGQFLDLSNGTPSDDTFRRVISRLDPTAFENRFRRWTAAVKRWMEQENEKQSDVKQSDVKQSDVKNNDSDSSSEAIIALDGKTLRESFGDRPTGTSGRA